jgi:hypothetical protein
MRKPREPCHGVSLGMFFNNYFLPFVPDNDFSTAAREFPDFFTADFTAVPLDPVFFVS